MITQWYLWCAYNITLYQVKPGKSIQKNIDDDSENNEIMVINLYGDINDNNDNNNSINNINDNNNNNNNNNNSLVLCKISNRVLDITEMKFLKSVCFLCHQHRSVSAVDFEHMSHIFLLFLQLSLNMLFFTRD